MPEYVHTEALDGGLRYTERAESQPYRRPTRVCELWADGVDEYVSRCTILSFSQRIGSVPIASEGFGGVHTPPQHRQKGYVGRLLTHALSRMAERVGVAWLYGVNDLYHKFGFTSCWAECDAVLSVRDGLRVVNPDSVELRRNTPEDRQALCEVYNRDHATRPWSHVRTTDTWIGVEPPQSWSPGQEGVVAVVNGAVAGAALYDSRNPGTRPWRLAGEAWAADPRAARGLIAEGVKRAMAEQREGLTFLEPPDSTLGRALARAGCEFRVRTNPYGGGMGRILRRAEFVQALSAELARRAGGEVPDTVDQLAHGELVPDDSVLLRLLTGAWSWRDAEETGASFAEPYRKLFRVLFPGWGLLLPVAFTHPSDRY